jgi:NurA-like 5'-3' nuclease
VNCQIQKKESYNQRFDDSYHITNLIKDGEWRFTCAIDTKSTIQEVIDKIQYIYGLHSDIAENLAFSYYSYNKKGKKELVRMFIDEVGNGYDDLLLGNKQIVNEKGEHHSLTINDVDLSVRVPRGTQTEKDVSCDSKFMLRSVEGVGTTIRQALHWVDKDEPIYLFMDNAGGGGMEQMRQRVSMSMYC